MMLDYYILTLKTICCVFLVLIMMSKHLLDVISNLFVPKSGLKMIFEHFCVKMRLMSKNPFLVLEAIALGPRILCAFVCFEPFESKISA